MRTLEIFLLNHIIVYFDNGKCATKFAKAKGRENERRYSVIKCSTINKNCPFTF